MGSRQRQKQPIGLGNFPKHFLRNLAKDGMKGSLLLQYRVIIQLVTNLLLTSKPKFRFSMRPIYENGTFVLMSSTGGLAQPEWSPRNGPSGTNLSSD